MSMPITPPGDPWVYDLLLHVLDGDEQAAEELVDTHTGGDQGRTVELVGVLLSMNLRLAEQFAGGRDALRSSLQAAGVLYQLDELDRAAN